MYSWHFKLMWLHLSGESQYHFGGQGSNSCPRQEPIPSISKSCHCTCCFWTTTGLVLKYFTSYSWRPFRKVIGDVLIQQGLPQKEPRSLALSIKKSGRSEPGHQNLPRYGSMSGSPMNHKFPGPVLIAWTTLLSVWLLQSGSQWLKMLKTVQLIMNQNQIDWPSAKQKGCGSYSDQHLWIYPELGSIAASHVARVCLCLHIWIHMWLWRYKMIEVYTWGCSGSTSDTVQLTKLATPPPVVGHRLRMVKWTNQSKIPVVTWEMGPQMFAIATTKRLGNKFINGWWLRYG